MNETEPSTASETNGKSKQPSNSAFKQQRLAAWQPILTAGTVLPTFFVIGILFIPVGIGLFYFSNSVREVIVNYTDCYSVANSSIMCSEEVKPWSERDGKREPSPPCKCELHFQLETDFSGDVFMYYALTNFYQNHRRYVKSRDDNQLYGGTDKPSTDCAPFDVDKETGKFHWPCGAIANSMFQDEIKLYYNGPETKEVTLIRTGIAWESDKQFKFKNPDGWNATYFKSQTKFVKPKAWIKDPFELDPDNPQNNGLQNEDFIIWMRTAALPNFRKLYRKVSREDRGFIGGMPKGNYTLEISYSYPVKAFQGTKSIIFSTTSLLGGKNPFLGISYIVVGAICLVLGIVFLFVHINYGKSTWEMTNIDSRTSY